MLLTVSFTFFLLVTPYCVFFISRNYWVDRRKPHIFASAALVNAITFCLMQTNNSINFFLYFLTGQRFRNELKAIVCGRKPTKTMTTSMSNIMSSTTNVSDNTQMWLFKKLRIHWQNIVRVFVDLYNTKALNVRGNMKEVYQKWVLIDMLIFIIV